MKISSISLLKTSNYSLEGRGGVETHHFDREKQHRRKCKGNTKRFKPRTFLLCCECTIVPHLNRVKTSANLLQQDCLCVILSDLIDSSLKTSAKSQYLSSHFNINVPNLWVVHGITSSFFHFKPVRKVRTCPRLFLHLQLNWKYIT